MAEGSHLSIFTFYHTIFGRLYQDHYPSRFSDDCLSIRQSIWIFWNADFSEVCVL